MFVLVCCGVCVCVCVCASRILEEKIGRLAWILIKTCSAVQEHVKPSQGRLNGQQLLQQQQQVRHEAWHSIVAISVVTAHVYCRVHIPAHASGVV